jgi:hypothetical protein
MSIQHSHFTSVDFETSGQRHPAAPLIAAETHPIASQDKINWVASTSVKGQIISARQIVVALGITGMLSWLFVFGVGMLINSKTYRDQLAATFDLNVLAKAILTFTPTNVAVLAILAGFLGGCASLLMYSDYDPSTNAKQNGKAMLDEERLAYLRENPISSALRGFVVYLGFLAGTVFGANGAFTNTTQDQYCRLAGAVAVLAFGVGYDPTVFRQVLSLVTRRADSGAKPNQSKGETDHLSAPVATK